MRARAHALEEPARILVIDDSPTVLRVMETVLSGAGHEVTCLDSAWDAVDVARRIRPELIFVDFAMPDTNGYAVCRLLGEQDELETIPIVLMNTRGDAIGERFVRDMGIVDHITKPFAPEALLAVVEHTLAKTRGTDPGLRRRTPAEARRRRVPSDPTAAARRRLAETLADRLHTGGGASIAATFEAAFSEPALLGELRLAAGADAVPALAGDLSAVPIAEVLQLLALQRQTGSLAVHCGSSEVNIAVENGNLRLVTGTGVPEELLLGSILVQEQLIDRAELDVVLGNRRGSRRRLGTQLVKLGYLTREDLHRALRRQSTELVYEILRWGAGDFAFEKTDSLAPEVLEFELELRMDEVLMEGFRRVDEWGLIEEALPSFELVPRKVPGGTERIGDPGLTPSEEAVLAVVDGRRTVHEIVQTVGLGTFDTVRLLYRLVAARVVDTGQ
jgi:CheY-like chemotaxis protein